MNTCIDLRLDYSKSTTVDTGNDRQLNAEKNRVSTRATIVPFYTASYVNTVNMYTEMCVWTDLNDYTNCTRTVTGSPILCKKNVQ